MRSRAAQVSTSEEMDFNCAVYCGSFVASSQSANSVQRRFNSQRPSCRRAFIDNGIPPS